MYIRNINPCCYHDQESISLHQAAIKGILHTEKDFIQQGKWQTGNRFSQWTLDSLTKAEGDMIADWAFNMTRMVFGRTRSEILDTVQCIIKQDGRAFPFVNCRPGKDKYHAFLKRHPELYT